MEQATEFFKLKEIDRKVFFWLIDRVNIKAIKSWIDYIEEEYKRKSITINADLLFNEALTLRKKQSVESVNEVTRNYSTMKLPSHTELTLQLIREELKCRKLFNTLRKLGLHDCPYQPNLDNLIMAYVGLPNNDDKSFEFYYSVMDTHSELINETRESVVEQALEVYGELTKEIKIKLQQG